MSVLGTGVEAAGVIVIVAEICLQTAEILEVEVRDGETGSGSCDAFQPWQSDRLPDDCILALVSDTDLPAGQGKEGILLFGSDLESVSGDYQRAVILRICEFR